MTTTAFLILWCAASRKKHICDQHVKRRCSERLDCERKAKRNVPLEQLGDLRLRLLQRYFFLKQLLLQESALARSGIMLLIKLQFLQGNGLLHGREF